MTETYYAGAYWGQRQETIEACTDRAHRFLSCLAECHPTFREWRVNWRPVSKGQKLSMPFDRETLTQLLLKGRSRYDSDNQVIEDLGFALGVWTPVAQGSGIALSLHCGCYSPVVGNNCVLDLNSPIETYTTSALLAVVECLVVTWDPEEAFIISREYRDRILDQYGEDAALVGWITYIRAESDRLRALLPSSVQIHSLDEGENACLVVITDETFTVEDQSLVARADLVRSILIEQELI